jgi:hypothetical protein
MARIIDLRGLPDVCTIFAGRLNGKSAFTSVPSCRAVIVAMAHQVIALKAYPRTKADILQEWNVW